jgi:hypothetical protein
MSIPAMPFIESDAVVSPAAALAAGSFSDTAPREQALEAASRPTVS